MKGSVSVQLLKKNIKNFPHRNCDSDITDLSEVLKKMNCYSNWLKKLYKFGFDKNLDYTDFSSFFNEVYDFCLSETSIKRLKDLKKLINESEFLFGLSSVYLNDLVLSFVVDLRMVEYKKLSESTLQYVYIIQNQDKYKIGRTMNLSERLSALRISAPDAKLIAYKETNSSIEEERFYHNFFYDKHYKREWFNLTEADLDLLYTCGFKKYN